MLHHFVLVKLTTSRIRVKQIQKAVAYIIGRRVVVHVIYIYKRILNYYQIIIKINILLLSNFCQNSSTLEHLQLKKSWHFFFFCRFWTSEWAITKGRYLFSLQILSIVICNLKIECERALFIHVE